ncbi:MAG: phosphoribosylformylglycinamidine synthase subunit PurS [Thermomicrobiales bacterium]
MLVMPKAGVNDPEGEAIRGGLHSLGYSGVERVRAGKHYRLRLDAPAADAARATAEEMAEKLLANPVIQTYVIESVTEASEL